MGAFLRLLGIVFVFVVAAAGWFVLAGITDSRSTQQHTALYGRVADLWGDAQVQLAPSFTLRWTEPRVSEKLTPRGVETLTELVPMSLGVDPDQSRIRAGLHADTRRKGLLWFPLYDVDFAGSWSWTWHGPPRDLDISFTFPDRNAFYDDFRLVLAGADLGDTKPQDGKVLVTLPVSDGQLVKLDVSYRSRGQGRWTYRPAADVGNIADFELVMDTDFAAIDFPEMTLSPSTKERLGEGWRLTWSFPRVVTGYGMGMVLPSPVQPGELATQMAISAPLSLGFFFLMIFVLALRRGLEVHPVNYLFLAGAFFAFNLLFAYTADRLPVEGAFALASVVSLALVVSYLRLVIGARFAFVEAAAAQLVYQVGFALAHFWSGFTGLTVTVLAILTLFVLMQLTGRVRWSEVFAPKPRAGVA